MKRTKSEIDAEIVALEACKTYAPERSAFGENNHAKIDAQIKTLSNDLEIDSYEWDCLPEPEQSAALDAQNWKDGDDDDSPSSGWEIFKKKG